MSSASSTDTVVAEVLAEAIPPSFLQISAAPLFLFEYTITFSDEVALIWPRMSSGPSILFVVNRFVALIFAIAQVIEQADFPTVLGCKFSIIFGRVPSVLLYMTWAVFSTLRVYALARHAWMLSVLVLLILLIPTIFALYDSSQMTTFSVWNVSSTEALCVQGTAMSVGTVNKEHYLTSGSFILADVVVLGVTWWKTFGIKKIALSVGMSVDMVTALLRDGTFYFVGILLLNAVAMSLWASNQDIDLSTTVQMFNAIIISRFLLNLRGVGRDNRHPSTGVNSAFSTVNFAASVVGNMGEELHRPLGIGSSDSALDQTEEDNEETWDSHESSGQVEHGNNQEEPTDIMEVSRA